MKEELRCQKCGHSVGSTSDFCPNCGAMLFEPLNLQKAKKRHEAVNVESGFYLGFFLTVFFGVPGLIISCCVDSAMPDAKRGAFKAVLIHLTVYLIAGAIALIVFGAFYLANR
jgi:hypothetical protein